jgi:hypothetical protein
VLAAADHFGQPLQEIAHKLAELGFQVPPVAEAAEYPDRRIISWELDAKASWLETDELIPSHHVVAAADLVQRPIGEVARQLVDFGLQVADNLLSVNSVEPTDLVIISRDLTGEEPWLRQWDENDRLVTVPVGHIVAAAEKTSQTVGKVARRLAALGFQVPSELMDVGSAEPADRIITSRDLTGEEPWLTERLVPLGHILTAAEQLNEPEKIRASRLTMLGFDAPVLPPHVAPNDVVTISWELSTLDQQQAQERRYVDRGWWLNHDAPVPMWHVIAGAAKTRTTVEHLTGRLRSLGFQIPATLPSHEPTGFEQLRNPADAGRTEQVAQGVDAAPLQVEPGT